MSFNTAVHSKRFDFFSPLSYVRVSLKGSGRLMPCVLLGPSNLVDSENCATNEEVDPDAVALSAFFDLYPNQQEAYEESVAKGQIDATNAYRARAGLEALGTKSTPFRLIGTATAVV
jgi:hypothetical protein